MESIELENLIKSEIATAFGKIIEFFGGTISVKYGPKAGPEIVRFLQDQFVINLGDSSCPHIYGAECFENGYIKVYFRTDDDSFDDVIFCNVKAMTEYFDDDNPDLGDPDDVIGFIQDGHFYVMYVLLICESSEDGKVSFGEYDVDGSYAQCMFLKDAFETLHVDENNRLQLNILDPEEYRSRDAFLRLFSDRYPKADLEDLRRCLKAYEEKMGLS